MSSSFVPFMSLTSWHILACMYTGLTANEHPEEAWRLELQLVPAPQLQPPWLLSALPCHALGSAARRRPLYRWCADLPGRSPRWLVLQLRLPQLRQPLQLPQVWHHREGLPRRPGWHWRCWERWSSCWVENWWLDMHKVSYSLTSNIDVILTTCMYPLSWHLCMARNSSMQAYMFWEES